MVLELHALQKEEELGSGGFAEVWRVRRGGREVLAMKVAQEGKERYMFLGAQGAQPLRHPCIVRSVSCPNVQRRPAYLMPLAHCSLANLLEDEKWRSWWDLAAQELMGYQKDQSVLSALFRLQAAGSVPQLLHQDIKAENVLVTHAPGSVPHLELGCLGLVLADWGCAAREGAALRATTKKRLPPDQWKEPKLLASKNIEFYMLIRLVQRLAKEYFGEHNKRFTAVWRWAPFWLRRLSGWMKEGWDVSALLLQFSPRGQDKPKLLDRGKTGDFES